MDFPTVINRIHIFVGCCVCFLAFVFLTIAVIYRHRCFTFSTLLACNTILATFLYSFVNTVVAIYMLMWDQETAPTIDALCSFRAYIHHSTMAAIHHSLVLQAIEKYLKIKGINFFHNEKNQVVIVLVQWTVDFSFGLPVFLTGNMPKLSSDNLCFISITRLDLLFYMVTISFFLSDILLAILYRRLVHHVRAISLRVLTNKQIQMRRDLTVVRRIVLLNAQLAIVGLVVITFIILGTIRADLLPSKWIRPLLLANNTILCPMIIILFWITPNLRQSSVKCLNKLTCFPAINNNRVVPFQERNRF